MKNFKFTSILFLSFFFLSHLSLAQIDINDLDAKLQSQGVEVEVHGAPHDLGHYVVTVRSSQNFFDYLNLSFVPEEGNQKVVDFFSTLKRHDRIWVKGELISKNNPQKHILAKEVKMIKSYNPGLEMGEYQRQVKIPDELVGRKEAIFKVHAVHEGGAVLVLEYKDAVIPVINTKADLAKNLWRNDFVKVKYFIKSIPGAPTHLKLNTQDPKAIEVIEAVKDMHDKEATLEGTLVLFPQSPQVKFNVFALKLNYPGELSRTFTLINFEDPAMFEAVRQKAQKAWDQSTSEIVNDRNKLEKVNLKIRVKGKLNEIDPNQANPQIRISKLEDFEVLP